MQWAEEDIAALVEQRSELLCMVAYHRRGQPDTGRRSGGQANSPADDLAALKRRLAEVEAHLADAGLSFGS